MLRKYKCENITFYNDQAISFLRDLIKNLCCLMALGKWINIVYLNGHVVHLKLRFSGTDTM